MVKKILRYLHNKYPIWYSEIMVESFLGETPKKVSQPAITILSEQKHQLINWLTYEGYLLTRRCVSDPKRADFYLGILTNIKVLIKLIEGESKKSEYVKGLGKVKTALEYKKELDEDLLKIEKFKKGVEKE